MQQGEVTNPKNKALTINLDATIFGSFAEIGAGQDVARRFFEAGAASGTIAKTISAYDMTVSDTMYGKSTSNRYVSQDRLRKMLKVEFESITGLLKGKKEAGTRFFAFADTVSVVNFAKTNEPHGWMGVRFQLHPDKEPCEVILHVKLLENDFFLQQRTMGILGVNLLYACYNYFDEPVKFIKSLLDYLSTDQIEIDMMEFCNDKICIDGRLLSLLLVKHGLSKATTFDRNMNTVQPADLLYNKDVMLLRGSFSPPTYVAFDMLKSGSSKFKRHITYDKSKYLMLCEMSLDNIVNQDGEFNPQDYLNRVDLLCGMGMNVMISNYRENYRLLKYISKLKTRNLSVVIGVLTLIDVFDKKYYTHLAGGLLEAMGHLFLSNTKFYVYPALSKNFKSLLTSKELEKDESIIHLYKHLIANGQIEDLTNIRKDTLHIFSRTVKDMIQRGNQEWENQVPNYIRNEIKSKWMFGYKEGVSAPNLGSFNL